MSVLRRLGRSLRWAIAAPRLVEWVAGRKRQPCSVGVRRTIHPCQLPLLARSSSPTPAFLETRAQTLALDSRKKNPAGTHG